MTAHLDLRYTHILAHQLEKEKEFDDTYYRSMDDRQINTYYYIK